jgi:hypothetical protein
VVIVRLLALNVLIVLPTSAAGADYLGRVLAVSDGDTFTMEAESGKVRVRICGIDAPERGQSGYGQAAGVLSNMIEGKQVHCLQVGEGTPCDGRSKPTSRDRIVAQCFLDTLDIAEEWRSPERPATGRSSPAGTTRSTTTPASGNDAVGRRGSIGKRKCSIPRNSESLPCARRPERTTGPRIRPWQE